MMYYFTDDCLIGVEMIDNEHRELFRIINETQTLLGDDGVYDKYDHIQEMIGRLEKYAEEHFLHEEEYMESIGHPELELQRQQHMAFCNKISEVKVPSLAGEQQAFLDDLLKYLVTWLYRHIIGSDLMIGKMKKTGGRKEPIEFTDDYLIGVPSVDGEHKELFRIIGEVHRVMEDDFIPDKYDEIIHLLKELKRYTVVHFAHEEKYMQSINYSGLEAQQRAHDAFAARLEEMDLERIDARQQETLEELLEFLTKWLVNHILNSDKKIEKG